MADDEEANNDVFQETETSGFFGNLGDAFAGVCVGFLLFFGAFPLLWWNEGRAVDNYQAIREGRDSVIEISSASVNPNNNGKLVYITGLAEPTTSIQDSSFGVEAFNKTRLGRQVELYQWVESKSSKKEKQLGGGTKTVTTYSYNTQWRTSLIDSSGFKKPEGHTNPTSMPYMTEQFYSDVVLGAFDLPTDIVNFFPSDASLDGTTVDVDKIPNGNLLNGNVVTKIEDGFYFGNDPLQATVGDTRVQYDTSSSGTVSIIAMQSGDTFLPFTAKSGATLYLFQMGTVTPGAMFDKAVADNKTLTMILRIVGALVMSFGIGLVLNPFAVFADIIPCIGDCVQCAIGLVSAVIGIFLSLVVIGIAWLAYRPAILGVGLAGAAVVGYFVYKGVQKKQEKSKELEGINDLEMERE